MQGSRRRADAPATGYPINVAANANEASYPQPPSPEVTLREKNAKKAKQEDALPASTQVPLRCMSAATHSDPWLKQYQLLIYLVTVSIAATAMLS